MEPDSDLSPPDTTELQPPEYPLSRCAFVSNVSEVTTSTSSSENLEIGHSLVLHMHDRSIAEPKHPSEAHSLN